MHATDRADRAGTLAALGAFGLWGLFPLVFRLVDEVPAFEILLHRIVWSLVVVVGILGLQRRLPELGTVWRSPRQVGLLVVAAALISVNWFVYIWAVNGGHVVDAALGYYVNPLLSVAIGVVVLHERLRRAQRVALGLGAGSVVVLTVAYGAVPWIALVLATSFGTYGYVKKAVDVAAVPSLAVETAVLTPLAIVAFGVVGAGDGLAFGSGALARDALLVGLGVVTATPLLLFATAARRIPLSLLGLIQYVTPTLQLLCGVLLLGESLPPERLVGFALVWAALSVLGVDAVHAERGRRRAGPAAPGLSVPAAN